LEIDKIEHITRLNCWLEIIHGSVDALSWPSGYTREQAYELYKYFKNQPERSKRKDLTDYAWIKWSYLVPPKDVKGIFIRFDNDQIWTDEHFYGRDEYRQKTCGDAKPIEWTFMERSNSKEKSVRC